MKKILITLELEVSDDFGSSKLDVVQDDVIDGIVLFRKDWEETPEDEEQFKLKDVKIRNIDKIIMKEEWERYENGWFCTDSDNDQYCRKINDTTFDFAELNFAKDWVRETIRLENYTDDEIEEFLEPYGFIEEVENQIIAECIFETEFMGY